MKFQAILVVLLSVGMLPTIGTVGQAATFAWTGGTDLDWDNPLNWTGGSVPLQSDMGAVSSSSTWNTVQFSGNTMPTVNVKDLGYSVPGNDGYYYTAKLELNSGGTVSMGLQSRDNGLCNNNGANTMLIIGDGAGGGTEDVTLQFTESLLLARHPGGLFTTIVNSDGELDVVGTLTMVYHDTRDAVLDVIGGTVTADTLSMLLSSDGAGLNTNSRVGLSDGGTVTIDGPVIRTMLSLADSGAVIRFQDKSPSSFFTAQYGGDLPDLATVEGSLGTLFVSETDWTLLAEDVGGGYFKVTAVPEPGCLALCILGALCLLTGRRRKR